MSHPASPEQDGRVARGLRTREALLIAYEELLSELGVPPTGAQLARRAGVSCRSIFTHFGDMDGVIAEVARRILRQVTDETPGPKVDGTLADRISHFVVQQALALEIVSPLYRGMCSPSDRSPAMTEVIEKARAMGRDYILASFTPELEGSGTEDRALLEEAIISLTTWRHWEGLRSDQGLSVRVAREVIRVELEGVLTRFGFDTGIAA